MEKLLEKLDLFTIILTLVVILVYVVSATYVFLMKKQNKLESKRRWIEQLPSFVSTCGVLGTFIGITIGLVGFETTDLSKSIPTLLEGMSTAFFTSLAGMIGSLLLSKQVNSYFDDIDKGVSDTQSATTMIVNIVQQLISENKKQNDFLCDINNKINNIYGVTNEINNIGKDVIPIINSTQNNTDNIVNIVQSNEKEFKDIVSVLQKMNSNLDEMLDVELALPKQVDKISENVSKLTNEINGEFIGIENAMNKTNDMLEKKFNEFTELLKKSNTEALVEVMKKVTEEFQKQMGTLINKLVKENFDQLNKSVEQLNVWQKENKEMIVALTKQYKQMVDNLDATSTILTKVGVDTKLLVSEGGKLRQIIDALNKVFIEDSKFIEVTTMLEETAVLTKNNMQKFDDSTNVLNEWVKKQRDFVEGVYLLINKLDDINKINDYSDEFWKNTKKGLNDAVESIQGSINNLNAGLEKIDEHFYNRLSATLSELDRCIQTMIKGKE